MASQQVVVCTAVPVPANSISEKELELSISTR